MSKSVKALLGFALTALVAGVSSGQSPSPAQRLADRLASDAMLMLELDPLTLPTVQAAVVLMEESVSLTPDDHEAWRIMLEMAELAERDDLRAEAIRRIAELDPADEVMRWRRATLALERYQTAEELIAGYESLLTPEARRELGNVVASRLALDLTLLHQRRGDDREVGRWLAEATALDPGNRAAAALAAGYFRTRVDDVVGQAELLTNVLLSDPVDLTAQIELGRLLFENGAYRGAYRVLEIASHSGGEIVPELYADLTMLEWALGRPAAAKRTIELRQRVADERHRAIARAERPDIAPLELAQMSTPLDPVLATVRAAMLERLGHRDAAAALEQAVESYEKEITDAASVETPDAGLIAQLFLEQAWIVLWLGGDPALAQQCVDEANNRAPMSDEARTRFEGWSAWRSGDLTTADNRLASLPEDDSVARLGRALVALDRGETRAAARHLLSVVRAKPGSLISIWAAEHLYQIVGQRTELHDSAQPLEELIASIPDIFDRYMREPTFCLSVRLNPVKQTFDAYEPIALEIEITNSSPYPLSISRDGPIRSQVLLEVTVSIPRRGSRKMDPIIVDIGRRLTLPPRGRLTVPVDLRLHHVGQMLDDLPMLGANLRARCMLNFQFTASGAIVSGALGSHASTPPIRVDGVRFSRGWIESSMADLVASDQPPRDARRLAMLSHLAGAGLVADLPPEDQQLFRDAVSAMSEGYSKLDPISQAWILSVMRPGAAAEGILAMARKSEHRLVKSAYLIYCVTSENDPMIDAARRDADPKVRELADIALELIRNTSVRQAPEAGGLTRGG
jgi:Tfp pilus assembly protein PilF